MTADRAATDHAADGPASDLPGPGDAADPDSDLHGMDGNEVGMDATAPQDGLDSATDDVAADSGPEPCDPGDPGCTDLCGATGIPAWAAKEGPATYRLTLGVEGSDAAFDLVVTLLDPSVVRLRYLHGPSPNASYAVLPWTGPAPAVQAGGNDSWFDLCTDSLRVRVAAGSGRVTLFDPDGNVLLSEPADGGYSRKTVDVEGAPVQAVSVTRTSPADERYLGFGEKTGKLDKRGRKLQFWNSDNPAYSTTQDPLYQSIPFFISLRGGVAFGQFMDNSHRASFDMAAAAADRYVLTADGGEMDLYLVAGPAVSQVVERYTQLTGRMPMPPRWTLGYHQCRWSYFPDTKVQQVCEEFRKRSLPADGMWLDIDYMDGFRSWTWSPVHFPDPSGLVQSLEALGFKVTAIIDPGLKKDPAWDLYQQGIAGKHFLQGKSGEPFVGEVWPGAAVFPDFTRPATRDWWGTLVTALTDHGVRGIWLDMNEPASFLASDGNTVPGWVAADGDGNPTTMAEIHNVYALEECRATRDGLLGALPQKRPFLLTRAGFAGIQRYSAVWTGDAASKMESLEDTLPMLLGLGLSGVAFVGSDVGGWSGGATPELFARWMQVGAISPFYRGHVQTGAIDQEPWEFGTEVEDISRITLGLRYRLLPYLYSLFHQASQTGAPILRPLLYEFQQDAGSIDRSYQAMLGPHVMFAPVLSAGAKQLDVYFPPGSWIEMHSGARYEGPGSKTVGVTLQALPVFLREGAIVPLGPVMQHSDQKPVDPLRIDLFAGPEASHFDLYEDDGETNAYLSGAYAITPLTLQQAATGAVLSAGPRQGTWTPPGRRILVHLRRVDHAVTAVTLNGVALAEAGGLAVLEAGSNGWYRDANDLSLWAAFPDPGEFSLDMSFDTTPGQAAPQVLVPVKVVLPADTPAGAAIFIATSASGWAQTALEPGPGNTAVGNVPVPRGEWFEYKYTRGDWSTVEKWAGCAEASNRYAFGTAHPVKEDTVEAWADQCP